MLWFSWNWIGPLLFCTSVLGNATTRQPSRWVSHFCELCIQRGRRGGSREGETYEFVGEHVHIRRVKRVFWIMVSNSLHGKSVTRWSKTSSKRNTPLDMTIVLPTVIFQGISPFQHVMLTTSNNKSMSSTRGFLLIIRRNLTMISQFILEEGVPSQS
jgi:hypothetical protein